MNFNRIFTNTNWLNTIQWGTRDVQLIGSDGKIVFEMKDVEAPVSWSDNAVIIVASKYFKKINGELETSVKSLVNRVLNKIIAWGQQFHYFDTDESEYAFRDELEYLILNQMACFNSPIWFNFGVPGRAQQSHACFLVGLEDTTESIIDWTAVESLIFKNGSGSGVNLSNLRPKNANLSSGGKSSGPVSFMKGADVNAGIWKSGGATRRAATLRCLNIDHPDAEEFITCKVREEKKARVLIEAGYDSSIDGEAYTTVAFQNMNHSIRVSDAFMQSVKDDDTEANRLLQLTAQCAWESGDPGIQFDTTINTWNTIPNSGRINTSNPCSEFMSTDWSACLLASFNLVKFWDAKTGFTYGLFKHAVDLMTVALDIIISGADYPHEKFATTSHHQRQMGLGYSNLGALLMLAGLPYGSDAGRLLAANITSCMTAEAYLQSANIAEELGSFTDYTKNKDEMLHVIEMHRNASSKQSLTHTNLWNFALERGHKVGYRNSVVTLLAPTGTISFMMDCDTTGIEPEFSLVKYKTLVGGGTLALPSNIVEKALLALGYTEHVSDMLEYIKENGELSNCQYLSPEDLSIFDCAVSKTRYIDFHDHLKMVAAVQPFLSMSISKTINMPSQATVEDVFNLYFDAWELGIKSLAIYRDGCKQSQPLNITKEVSVVSSTATRRKMPHERKSITHKIDIAGFEGYLTAGLYPDGSLGEIFITGSKQGSTVDGLLDALAVSVSVSLQYGVPLKALSEKLVNTRFDPAGFTKNQEIPTATSIPDYVFRWLDSKFSKDTLDKQSTSDSFAKSAISDIVPVNGNGHVSEFPHLMKARLNFSGQICNSCGSVLVRSGTCLSCKECGEGIGGCGA